MSIRPGWFYHAAEDARVRRSTISSICIFSRSGRNAKLLLNVPPTRDGLLHETDVSRLTGFAERRQRLFGVDLAEGRRLAWRRTGPTATVGDIDLGRSATVGIIRLEEDIAHGQVVARYTVSGANGGDWRVLSRGNRRSGTRGWIASSPLPCDVCA